nr:hypothetical protein [Brevibacillus halotolerans]
MQATSIWPSKPDSNGSMPNKVQRADTLSLNGMFSAFSIEVAICIKWMAPFGLILK